MRRILLVAGATLLVLSLAGNVMLGRVAWTAQKEYRALAKQFVKVRGELQKLQAQAEQASRVATKPQPTPAAQPEPAAPPEPAAEPEPVAQPESAAQPAPAMAAAPGLDSLRARYTQRLSGVQATCEGQLNSLLDSARAEYEQAKHNGSKVDVAALAGKYYARADGLRRQCDRLVEAELQQLAGELRAAGLPPDLTDEIRAAYEGRIAERQAEIMAKAPAQ